jgi:glycosyltransferase involved in cell wall biosynthesis
LATARSYLSKPEYKIVVFSYISTAGMLLAWADSNGRQLYIVTQNDELELFNHLRATSRNPLSRVVASTSIRWLRSFLSSNWDRFVFLHVSEEDRRGYLDVAPKHVSHIMPVGVDERPGALAKHPSRSLIDRVRLLFVGSLGIKQNVDALRWFSERFYPTLRGSLAGDLEVNVVGSAPGRDVVALCKAMSWNLFPDVSERELDKFYMSATFALLPFPYTTGVKLKLLEALSYGVPVLATAVLVKETSTLSYPCLTSDQPFEWLGRAEEVRRAGITSSQRLALASHVREWSWDAVAKNLFLTLSKS